MVMEVIQDVPLEKFILDENIRDRLNLELVDQISHSFATVGQLQPCRARPAGGLFSMVDGYHRHAAAVKAKWKMLATIVEQRELCEGEVLQRQLIVNGLREDLSPLEKAAGMQRLMELTDWPANRVAAELGFSPATVTRLLALLSLPDSIIGQVQTGKIPASAAYELARIDDPVRQAEFADKLAAGELTRDGLSGAQKAARKKSSGNGETQAVRATAQLGADRSVTVSGPSLTLEGLIQILEELLAKARRERTRGVELSTFVKVLRDQSKQSAT